MPVLTIPGEEAAIGILDAGVTAALGYIVVFSGLILLMVVVTLVGKFFTSAAAKKEATPVSAPAAPVQTESAADAPTAPGAAGEVKLHNVEPKTAAMLMAIVADKMQKPINELRFISIKEVE